MKTAQEAAIEYLREHGEVANYEEDDYNAGYNEGLFSGFLDGARWAEEWISVKDECPKDEDLILAKDPDGYIDLMQGWQLKERIKPYAVDDFYTAWRPIERKTVDSGREPK